MAVSHTLTFADDAFNTYSLSFLKRAALFDFSLLLMYSEVRERIKLLFSSSSSSSSGFSFLYLSRQRAISRRQSLLYVYIVL